MGATCVLSAKYSKYNKFECKIKQVEPILDICLWLKCVQSLQIIVVLSSALTAPTTVMNLSFIVSRWILNEG